MEESESNVRVVRGDPADAVGEVLAERDEPRVSRAQQRLESILNDCENELREARDLVDSALEDFSLITQPQHKDLSVLIGQQIEQVIEYRRMNRR